MRKYIGDRAFYKKVFFLMIPIMIQNGITNFVSLLDNFMVGRVGTEVMTGVASSSARAIQRAFVIRFVLSLSAAPCLPRRQYLFLFFREKI